MPPLLILRSAGGITFSNRSSVCACVFACVLAVQCDAIFTDLYDSALQLFHCTLLKRPKSINRREEERAIIANQHISNSRINRLSLAIRTCSRSLQNGKLASCRQPFSDDEWFIPGPSLYVGLFTHTSLIYIATGITAYYMARHGTAGAVA